MSKKFDSQTLMAIGVLLVSFVALFVSVRQTSIMSEQTRLLVEQNKASAWPHIEIDLNKGFVGNREDGFKINQFEVVITNKGTGPAIVESVRVLFDGKAASSWGKLFQLADIPDSIPSGVSNSTVMNSVIASNERVNMLNLSNNQQLMEFVYEHGDKISIEICYKSVYDDHWTVRRVGFRTNLEQPKTERVEACTANPEELFLE